MLTSREVELALLDEVLDAAGGADDDVDALLERADLAALRHAAVDLRGEEADAAGDRLDRAVDLQRELARRGEDERLRRAAELAALAGLRAQHALDERCAERDGLARAGAAAGEHVLALEDRRDRRGLDRERRSPRRGRRARGRCCRRARGRRRSRPATFVGLDRLGLQALVHDVDVLLLRRGAVGRAFQSERFARASRRGRSSYERAGGRCATRRGRSSYERAGRSSYERAGTVAAYDASRTVVVRTRRTVVVRTRRTVVVRTRRTVAVRTRADGRRTNAPDGRRTNAPDGRRTNAPDGRRTNEPGRSPYERAGRSSYERAGRSLVRSRRGTVVVRTRRTVVVRTRRAVVVRTRRTVVVRTRGTVALRVRADAARLVAAGALLRGPAASWARASVARRRGSRGDRGCGCRPWRRAPREPSPRDGACGPGRRSSSRRSGARSSGGRRRRASCSWAWWCPSGLSHARTALSGIARRADASRAHGAVHTRTLSAGGHSLDGRRSGFAPTIGPWDSQTHPRTARCPEPTFRP